MLYCVFSQQKLILLYLSLCLCDISVKIPGGQPFVIKNDKGAPFMAFDAFEMEFCR